MKKKLLTLVAVIALLGLGSAKRNEAASVIYAEEGSSLPPTSEVVNEEEPVDEEEGKVIDKIANFRDTFLVPLLSGVSFTSLSAAIFSAFIAFKNRKTYKLLKLANEASNKLAQESMEKAQAIAERATKIAENAATVLQIAANKGEQIYNETNALVVATKEQSEQLYTEVKGLASDVAKMLTMRECMLMLINIQAELAKVNPKAVSEGVTKQIAQVQEEAKKMM